MNDEQIRELANNVVAWIRPLSDDDRYKLLSKLRGEYCFGCGGEQPDHGCCQCDNDD